MNPHLQRSALNRWAFIAAIVLMLSQAAQAQVVVDPATGTRQHSSLYYRAGGGDPSPLAANPNAINLKFGLSGNALLNYSCGKFDIGSAFDYYMSEYAKLGKTISGAMGAAVAALPLYLFQRANPGLYETFQQYWAKAQVAISASLKTCEEMEAQIKAGGDPYEDYVKLAKGEGWKAEANAGTNVVKAKETVQRDGGNGGLQVFQGVQRGGKTQAPFRLVHDTTAVGYNVTMNQAPSLPKTTVFPATTRLSKLWSTPKDAADWAVSVLGDQEVATCHEADCGRVDGGIGKSVATGLGLTPKYQASISEVELDLSTMVASGGTEFTNLEKVSAPGVLVNKDVVDALRRLPAETRATMVQRMAREVALSKTVERALAVRNLLVSGMSAVNYEKPVDDARKRVDQLNRYIDDLMFEHRVRKEIVSSTAALLLENDRNAAAARSTSVPAGRQASPRALEDGRVAP